LRRSGVVGGVASVPRRLPRSSTVVCIASGPSLTAADVERCRGQFVVVVNDAVRLAPWADVLYAADERWWNHHKGYPSFTGLRYGMAYVPSPGEKQRTQRPDVQWLRQTGCAGIETEPTGLRVGLAGGSNSGYQAVNLAVHLGASRIVLLGYDMQPAADGRTHFFGRHPDGLQRSSPYGMFARSFEALVDPLQSLGIQIMNCSRATAITAIPRVSLDEALKVAA
jgi:hypothetical protein